jgi:hypothetical protein
MIAELSDPPPAETRSITFAEAEALHAAERSGLPFLHWRPPDGRQRLRMLDADHWRLTVGRNPEADMPLIWDQEVSRTHALLERVGEEWTVIDDGLSRNGSFVNGHRVQGRQRLHDGDRLCFGQTHIVYRQPPARETEESTARVSGGAPVPLTTMQHKVLVALCRPVFESSTATPATNKQIADEIVLSVDAVKAHLRILFERFGLAELPQNEKRARLAARALGDGILKPHDF